jgi:hypothetical protein
MKNFYLLIIGMLLNIAVFAQTTGTIKGVISDANTGEGVIGANVYIPSLGLGSSTGLDGDFVISKVPAGKYNLTITSIGYTSMKFEGVVVEGGKIVLINTKLEEESTSLAEIVVTGTRETNSDIAVITEIRAAKSVINAVSAEQISRLPDGDAAQILKRVPGITVVDNKFIRVRGVDDRYNNVMINGMIAPSTEINKRTFSFDMIPSSMIDRMLVSKSGAADMPGDFSGGMIKLFTTNTVDEDYTEISLGGGYRVGTTFGRFESSQTSTTDILGFDGGLRRLPSDFPSADAMANGSRELRAEAGRSLNNNFGLNSQMAAPNHKFRVTLARKGELGKYKINSINSFGYSRDFLFREVDVNKFFFYDPSIAPRAQYWQDYEDNNYTQEASFNVISNWSWRANARNKYDFKLLFNQIGENSTIIRTGEDFQQRTQDDLLFYSYYYLSRSILSTQLKGRHEITEDKSSFEWLFGVNYVDRNEPDFRRFRTVRPKSLRGTEAPYEVIAPASSNLFDNSRFYSRMRDLGLSTSGDYQTKWGSNVDRPIEFKAGYYLDFKSRNFGSRYFSYLLPGTVDEDLQESLKRLPLEERFAPENIDANNGWLLAEGTRGIDSYTGYNYLAAAYGQTLIPIKEKANLSAGLRTEFNWQLLYSTSGTGQPIEVSNPVLSPLPFANFDYNLSDKSLVRFGYGRSVNRPEFREIAPFLFYDFEFNWNINGNPNLQVANINNFDARWELYPGLGEIISVGAFYKRFNNPIENVLRVVTENAQINYLNAPSAYALGTELEVRKSFQEISYNPFIKRLNFVLNASLIQSRVDLGDQAVNQDRVRPLQGQSPYIFNTVLFYSDIERNYSVNLAYNIIGRRIFAVGDRNFPTIYELPRGGLDLKVSAALSSKWVAKFEVVNILNTAFRFYQDTNFDGLVPDELLDFIGGTSEATKIDDPILQYRTGQMFSFSLNYKFFGK